MFYTAIYLKNYSLKLDQHSIKRIREINDVCRRIVLQYKIQSYRYKLTVMRCLILFTYFMLQQLLLLLWWRCRTTWVVILLGSCLFTHPAPVEGKSILNWYWMPNSPDNNLITKPLCVYRFSTHLLHDKIWVFC